MLPSLFISHGSPMIALEDSPYTRYLTQLPQNFDAPKAIVVISAHYESRIQKVAYASDFNMIYDFGGFPRELSQIVYPAKGDVTVANRILDALHQAGIPAQGDTVRGLDHGVWTILHRMYPTASIPLVVLSVNPDLGGKQWFEIGKTLRFLKNEGVLLIGSGVTVHNLRRIDWNEDAMIMPWAKEFHDTINQAISTLDIETLNQWEKLPNASMAVPTTEHFAPLILLAGTATEGSKPELIYSEIQMGSLSYDVWRFE